MAKSTARSISTEKQKRRNIRFKPDLGAYAQIDLTPGASAASFKPIDVSRVGRTPGLIPRQK